MKKLWMAVVVVLFGFALIGCESKTDYEKQLIKAANGIEMPSQTTESLDLIDQIDLDDLVIDVTWTSNHSYITNEGVVVRPDFEIGDQEVTLTATLSILTYKHEKTFKVLVLKLEESKITYKVQFESNGGSSVSLITVNENELVTKPENPTKLGFDFLGWYTDEQLTEAFVFDQAIEVDLTLYAKWQQKKNTLSFNSNGGSDIEMFSRFAGSVLTKPEDPIKEGHLFLGWFEDENFQTPFQFGVMPSEDLVLFAKWEVKTEITIDYLDIFYLNDTHGSIEKKDYALGLAYISNYVNFHREQNPNGTILLSGGDMFQGSALSNYYMGLSTLNIMNQMGFDAMTLGNHEFDWGLEVIQGYFDGSYANNDANFPILASNAFYENSTNSIEHIDPYTIIERGQVKVGIIGTIGDGLESSIAQSRIDGYEFVDARSYVEYYTDYLRSEEQVDYVILMMHDNGSLDLEAISKLTGSKKIDLMLNAHTHQRYVREYSSGLLEVQSGSNGNYIGKIRIDIASGDIQAENVNSHMALNEADKAVQLIIDTYKLETDELFNTEIIRSESYYSQDDIALWLTKLIVKQTGASIAFQNYGGTRASINMNEPITLGKLFQIFPFDNVIKSVYLDGSAINSLKNEAIYSTDGTSFVNGKLYLVSTNDYLFDKTDGPFINGENPIFDGTLLRDLVEKEMRLQSEVYETFDVDNPILTAQINRGPQQSSRLYLQ
ncbi:MAG: InlB B-repeat-containing protein [Acholeplasma sp.]|nr:InlB B-repeat-containing protein [Acholeplasma sp.]